MSDGPRLVHLGRVPCPEGTTGYRGGGVQIQYHPSGSPVGVGLFVDADRARGFIKAKGWREVAKPKEEAA